MASPAKLFLTLSLCFHLAPDAADSAKILSVAFISSKSHKITYEPLLYELAARGHDVTIANPFVSGKNRTNVREIQTIEYSEKMMGNLFEKKLRGEEIVNPFKLIDVLYKNCEGTYDLPAVRQLIDEKFDLVFVSALMNECTAGLVHKLNTSVILISPVSAPSHVATVLGNPSPTSFVPHLLIPFEDRMNFWERTANFLVHSIWDLLMFYYIQPTMAELYRQKLHDPNIPLYNEVLRQHTSLILSNSHLSLSKPRPFLPDIVEVGGMHCHPAKPLPRDLDDFLTGSGQHGFIFFSMGSILKPSQMPESYRQVFLRVFGRLKQRVLWKWDTDMDDVPPNVKLGQWLPQQDILGHPKCKAFITHGGLGGTTEAAYHGVPLIGMPIMGDQATNLKKSEATGLALVLDFQTLTEDALEDAINRVLTNPSYHENAQRLSKIFRDQPDKPLDRAVFWTEYVIRHGGALHLRSAGRDLNFFAYHSIDVLATIVALLLALVWVIFALFRCIVRVACGGRKKSAPASATKVKKLN